VASKTLAAFQVALLWLACLPACNERRTTLATTPTSAVAAPSSAPESLTAANPSECDGICRELAKAESREHRLCGSYGLHSPKEAPGGTTPGCSRAMGTLQRLFKHGPKCSKCDPIIPNSERQPVQTADCLSFCEKAFTLQSKLRAFCEHQPHRRDYDNPKCYPLEDEYFALPRRKLMDCGCLLYPRRPMPEKRPDPL
jgi:hypothetical protein